MIRLVPMTPEEFRTFLETSARDYAQEHVRIGTWDPEEAEGRSRAEIAQLLPQGLETPDHSFRVVRDAGSGVRVGEVWTCLQRSGRRPQFFVYWIGIDGPYRRKGYASAVFRQLEAEAQASGASRLALHVFGDNARALALYSKLGFRQTNVMMAKAVPLP